MADLVGEWRRAVHEPVVEALRSRIAALEADRAHLKELLDEAQLALADQSSHADLVARIACALMK